jgi:hypothetical protein
MAQFVLRFGQTIRMVPKLVSRIWLICVALVASLAWAEPAAASLVFTLDQSGVNGPTGASFGTVKLDQIDANTVRVTVTLNAGENFAGTGAGKALTWDLLNHPQTVTVTGLPAGFAYLAPSAANPGEVYGASPFGNFQYAVTCWSQDIAGGACLGGDGPTGPLVFDVHLSTGLSLTDFIGNSNGFVFAVDIFQQSCNRGTGCTGVVGTNGNGTDVPEPASLLLFGAGVSGLAAYRRRRRLAKAA